MNVKDNEGHTPLHVAAEMCSVEVFRLLIEEYKMDAEQADDHEQTSIHRAARGAIRARNKEMIDYLREKFEVVINIQDFVERDFSRMHIKGPGIGDRIDRVSKASLEKALRKNYRKLMEKGFGVAKHAEMYFEETWISMKDLSKIEDEKEQLDKVCISTAVSDLFHARKAGTEKQKGCLYCFRTRH